MTSKKRINKYRQASVVHNPLEQTKSSFLQTRRHSWVGSLLKFSDNSKLNSSNFGQESKKEDNAYFRALDLGTKGKSVSTSLTLEEVKQSSKLPKPHCLYNDQLSTENARYDMNMNPPSARFNMQSNGNKHVATLNGETRHHPMRAPLLKQPHLSVPDLARLAKRRATIHYSSSGRPSLMENKRRNTFNSLQPNEMRAMEQFKDVCRDYIVYKLRQSNLLNRVTLDRKQANDHWLVCEVVFILKELERLQKSSFTDIAQQTGITIRSEEILRKMFFDISNEIITTEIPHKLKENNNNHSETGMRKNGRRPLPDDASRYTEITWGRLCAVLAIAGSLAIDCVQQGHSGLVNYIIDYVGEFACDEDILGWIVNQGGWEALKDLTHHTSSSPTNEEDASGYNRVAQSAIAFLFCALGATLAAITAGNISN